MTVRDYEIAQAERAAAERSKAEAQREQYAKREAEERAAVHKAELDAHVAALKRLKPALEAAMRQSLGDVRANRIPARGFLHGQIAGQFVEMVRGMSPRFDALTLIQTDIAGLRQASSLTGRPGGGLSDPAMLAELDATECQVWRALVETARIIAGEAEK
jgi:hypothetical protein